jgi:hypothetical protein
LATEVSQLRNLGFAEGLPIADSCESPGFVTILESGLAGVAVEFFDSDAKYVLVSLGATVCPASYARDTALEGHRARRPTASTRGRRRLTACQACQYGSPLAASSLCRALVVIGPSCHASAAARAEDATGPGCSP